VTYEGIRSLLIRMSMYPVILAMMVVVVLWFGFMGVLDLARSWGTRADRS
jgi:hypothetical protein